MAGALPAAIGANAMGKGLICPAASGPEAAWAGADIDIVAPRSLIALANHFRGTQMIARPQAEHPVAAGDLPDLADIKGQESAKRALEVAAAGGHNLLMVGPPGSGKSMLAQRLPAILPPLAPKELLEVSMIASVAGELGGGKLTDRRPFRAPHHSASMAAMVGGGLRVRPGEVSLAHHGVLFLDELPEFTPQVLDSLRQPIEGGECMIARANSRVTYPARIQLVAAMNPCRCGMAGEPGFRCARGAALPGRLSGAHLGPAARPHRPALEVPAVTAGDLIRPGAPSAVPPSRRGWRRPHHPARAFHGSACPHHHQRACADRGRRRHRRARRGGLALLHDASEKLGFGTRLSSRAESGAHAGRPRRRRADRAHPPRRGDLLPHGRGAAGASRLIRATTSVAWTGEQDKISVRIQDDEIMAPHGCFLSAWRKWTPAAWKSRNSCLISPAVSTAIEAESNCSRCLMSPTNTGSQTSLRPSCALSRLT